MSKPDKIGFFTGSLYEVEQKHGKSVVFQNDKVTLEFVCGIGGDLQFDEEHIVQEGEQTVYYPYYDETIARWTVQSSFENQALIETDISLKYYIASDDLYVASQSSITLYGPNYFTVNERLYAVEDIMGVNATRSFERDEFLGFDQISDAVLVQNIQSGLASGVKKSVVSETLKSDEPNGALKVREPDDSIEQIVRQLHEEQS